MSFNKFKCPVQSECKGCQDRTAECHSSCEKYKSFREKLDAEKANYAQAEVKKYVATASRRRRTRIFKDRKAQGKY